MGTGPDAEALKDYFAGTKTVLTGIMTGDALSQAFASADVFVMPSDSETLGFVVLESMASGVPVVGAQAGGIPDLIADGEVSFFDGGFSVSCFLAEDVDACVLGSVVLNIIPLRTNSHVISV